MNEPWCGDVYEDPSLLIPGVADRRLLQPVYDRVNDEIRKVDTEHLVFFEAVTWELVGIGEALGFTHPPGEYYIKTFFFTFQLICPAEDYTFIL